MGEGQTKRRPRELRSTNFRESLHSALTDRLRTMILTQHLKPGDRINELELSALLGVSRTPMRESLKVLASERLVTLFPYRGAIVTDLLPEVVEHLFEVEGILESQAAALACRRATRAEILQFETLHDRMVALFQQGDRSAYFEINHLLHKMMVAMAHNPSLAETHATVMTQIERARYAALTIDDRWQRSVEQHQAIIQALRDRDATRLQALVAQHVFETGQTIIDALRRRPTAIED